MIRNEVNYTHIMADDINGNHCRTSPGSRQLQEVQNRRGENGLDRVIDHVTVMGVPDVIQWLKGNDLLLTSLYPIKENQKAIQSLVVQLNDVNSSALAIKTQRYVSEIPPSIIEAGNRCRLPIIDIRNELSLPRSDDTAHGEYH